MNSQKIAAALRALAEAFETPAATADLPPAQPAAEPVKRGRGRPAKGEDTAPAAATASATASAVTGATAVGAGAATTSPSDDPFASPEPASAVPAATLDEVRAALKALAAATSQADALAVLKASGGADNLTGLPAAKYGMVVAAANVALRVAAAGRKAAPEADPFETTATPAAPTLEDVKAAAIAASKRTSQDTVQKVVMKHGGKAALPSGGEGPSIKALPEANYAACIAEINSLPTTK